MTTLLQKYRYLRDVSVVGLQFQRHISRIDNYHMFADDSKWASKNIIAGGKTLELLYRIDEGYEAESNEEDPSPSTMSISPVSRARP